MRLPLATPVLAVAAALLLSGCSTASPGAAPAASPVAFHGKEPRDDRRRPSFVLRDTSGRPYDFGAETGGTPTYVYFGYTSCADECPTAMADLAAALRRSPETLREKTKVVFITTDPQRDTGPVIRRFLDQFSTTFVGLTGTPAELEAAQRAAQVPVAERGGQQETLPGRPDQHEHAPGTAPHSHAGPLGYAVGHPDVILAYDAADRLPVVYGGGTGPEGIAADLPALADPPARPEESS